MKKGTIFRATRSIHLNEYEAVEVVAGKVKDYEIRCTGKNQVTFCRILRVISASH